MILKILINFFAGLIIGFAAEFVYRYTQNKKFLTPRLINAQMYGLTAVFLYLIYSLRVSLIYKSILIVLFATGIEFITGYSYFKLKKSRLWDYSNEFLNFKGIICPLFSFYWLLISLLYYFFILPVVANIQI